MSTSVLKSNSGENEYADCMQEIERRIKKINDVMSKEAPVFGLVSDIEFVALQLRNVLEYIVFANLAANIEEYQKIYQSYSIDWNIEKIVKRIKKINSNYYPRPYIAQRVNSNATDVAAEINIEPLEEGFLTVDECSVAYRYTSKLLHAHNPFCQNKKRVEIELKKLNEYVVKVITLLKFHQIRLVSGDELHCEIDFERGKLTVVKLKPIQ